MDFFANNASFLSCGRLVFKSIIARHRLRITDAKVLPLLNMKFSCKIVMRNFCQVNNINAVVALVTFNAIYENSKNVSKTFNLTFNFPKESIRIIHCHPYTNTHPYR